MKPLDSSFHSLRTLSSLSGEQIELLRKLDITNLGDLLAYQPFRYARFVVAARDQLLRKDEILDYLNDSVRKKELDAILHSPSSALRGVGRETAEILQQLGMTTVADVASFALFAEAEEIVTRSSTDDSDPFAPACVLPTCKKFTRNSKSFVSFFRQEEIRGLSIRTTTRSRVSLISSLFKFGARDSHVLYLGYSVSYLQEWVFRGVHLGEPQGSVNLFMGQDTQVSVLDWRRAMRASRLEDSRVTERLASTLFHQRAVDEVARATAEEHQYGSTLAVGANAATAGSFVAAGAIVGGVGGGIVGGLAGLPVDIGTGGATLGLATLSGAAIGTAVGSVAGAAAGSLIFSGATTLGFVETDAEGDREIFASSAQNIQQRTVQNSSTLRSFWSNIISQNVEEEQQQIRTDRVTNHNRIHALNALYFEVLNEYQVSMRANDFSAILFLPYNPIDFTEAILHRYWWLIRTLLNDQSLVLALDQHFLTLAGDPSPVGELRELPKIDDIKSNTIVVEVNLDKSAMERIIMQLAKDAGHSREDQVIAVAMFQGPFQTTLRENIKVSVVTSRETVALHRDDSQNSDPYFVGNYSIDRPIALHTIQSVRIENANEETVKIGLPHLPLNLTELAFGKISARVRIRNRDGFGNLLPNLGALEAIQIIQTTQLRLGGGRSETVRWNIADRLRDQFEGVNDARRELEAEIAGAAGAKIENLLGFLNANKFGFTRLILQNTEREQVINALEEVQIGDVDLSSIAGTTPLGFCGNHVVLPLRKCLAKGANHDPLSIDLEKLRIYLEQIDEIDLSDLKQVRDYVNEIRNLFKEFLHTAPSIAKSALDHELINRVQELQSQVDRFNAGIDNRSALQRLESSFRSLLDFINSPVQTNNSDMGRLCDFYSSVQASLKPRMGELLSTTEVSLPSPAVFMEPVLSNAKGAELYDMRRNSHYDILPSPGIGSADPNVLRSQDVNLTPTVPASTLSVLPPPDLPLPSSLAAALGEAGKLNLGTLIQSNASSLTSMLSNLSTMATELAKASATLSGDAQKAALASATDVAKQVGDIVGKTLQAQIEAQTTEKVAPPPAPTPSPQTQQEKAEVVREAERIDKGSGTPQQKKERKKTAGAATTPDDQRNYQFSIIFRDQDGNPYLAGSFQFRLTLTLSEQRRVVDLNGGHLLDLAREGFFFPETIQLTKGRKVILSLFADIGGEIVPGAVDLILPDSPDIIIECSMKSETREFQETSVKEAIDTAVRTSGFGVNAGILLDRFINAGAKFPFRIAEVNVDGTVKTVTDLKGEYNRGTTTTTGGTTTTTTVTTYKVTTPLNGWTIVVK